MVFRPGNGIDLASQRITSVADGVNPQDAATKGQLDSAVRGLDWHLHVRTVATVSTTVTAPGSAINGVTMATGDRVLLTAQSTGSQNGLWVYQGASAAMTRPTDYASGGVLNNASVTVGVTEGPVGVKDTSWTLTTDGSITIDTTATAWGIVGGGASYVNGNGLSLTGNTFAVSPKSGGGLIVDGTGVYLDPSVADTHWAANSVAATAGTPTTYTHGLGSLDVTVTTVEVSTGQEVFLDPTRTGVNTITLTSAAAVAAGQYRVIVRR